MNLSKSCSCYCKNNFDELTSNLFCATEYFQIFVFNSKNPKLLRKKFIKVKIFIFSEKKKSKVFEHGKNCRKKFPYSEISMIPWVIVCINSY